MAYLPLLLSICYLARDNAADGHIANPRIPDSEERDRETRNHFMDSQDQGNQENVDEPTPYSNPQETEPATTDEDKMNKFAQNMANHKKELYKNAMKGGITRPSLPFTGPSTTPPIIIPKEEEKKDSTRYKVILERGIVLENRGTIISYDSMDLMSVIIRIKPLTQNVTQTNCSELLNPIDKSYQLHLNSYKELLTQLMKPSLKLNEQRMCKLIGNTKCKQRIKLIYEYHNDNSNRKDIKRRRKRPNRRRRPKRFVAEGMAAAALAASATALGLAVDNKIQIEQLEEYLSRVSEDVVTITEELKNTNERQKKILDVQSNILGYIADIKEDIEILYNMIECTRIQTLYLQWYQEIIHQLKDILVYPLQGSLSGKLRPTIISPEDIVYTLFNEKSVHKSVRKLLTHLPIMFYASASTTLINFDMENLVFQYLIAFPYLDERSPILPLFKLHQTGFHTFFQHKFNESEKECLEFSVADLATRINGEWHVLNIRNHEQCPIIGSYALCPHTAYSLQKLSECIDIQLTTGDNRLLSPQKGCRLDKCITDTKYINLHGGLLLRSNENHASIIYREEAKSLLEEQESHSVTIPLSAQGTLWLGWDQSIASIQIENKVINNPLDPDKRVQIEMIQPINMSETLNLSQIFDVSFESQTLIKEIGKHQNDIKNLSSQIDTSINRLDTLGGFISFTLNPMKYLKIPLIVVAAIILCIIIVTIIVKTYPHCAKKRAASVNDTQTNPENSHQINKPTISVKPTFNITNLGRTQDNNPEDASTEYNQSAIDKDLNLTKKKLKTIQETKEEDQLESFPNKNTSEDKTPTGTPKETLKVRQKTNRKEPTAPYHGQPYYFYEDNAYMLYPSTDNL